jgi:hypothetical protein
MARVVALARTARAHPLEALRGVLVSGCALALILAGRALPF